MPRRKDGAQVRTSTKIREYIWADDRIVAVSEGGVLYFVRTDHIGRPVFATNGAGAVVWSASYLPFGGLRVSSGLPIDLRFPGQWFQSESGLFQNWMRDYDPTTGRYLQADPLGLVDGASVYGYARQSPTVWTDPTGEAHISPLGNLLTPSPIAPLLCGGQDCRERYDDEEENCRRRLRNYEISNLRACIDRAQYRFRLCIRNDRPESEWPPEWSDEDEGVPRPGTGSILDRLRGVPPLILPRPRRPSGGGGRYMFELPISPFAVSCDCQE